MKKRILFALTLLLSLRSLAQISIGMAQVTPAIDQDTIAPGYINTYNVWVKNFASSGSTFNDYVSIVTAVRDSTNPLVLDSVSLFTSVLPVTIAPGDSMMFSLTETLNVGPAAYRYGIDVIVVWPVALSAQTVDSLEYWVYIMDGAGVGELDINHLLQLYPNPAIDHLTIENKSTASIEVVSIYDLSGKLILSKSKESCINVESLPAGMYTIQVKMSNNKYYQMKFMKPKNSSE